MGYNNYCFSENTNEKVYNSDMILYFFNKFSQSKKIPNNLIDPNVRTDYGKLRFLIVEEQKIKNELNGNFSILSELTEKNETEVELIDNFSLEEIINKDKFKSFLYFLGLLSVKEHIFGSNYILSIPNQTIKTMHRHNICYLYSQLKLYRIFSLIYYKEKLLVVKVSHYLLKIFLWPD